MSGANTSNIHLTANLILHHIYKSAKLLVAVKRIALALTLEVINNKNIKPLRMFHLIHSRKNALLVKHWDVDMCELARF